MGHPYRKSRTLLEAFQYSFEPWNKRAQAVWKLKEVNRICYSLNLQINQYVAPYDTFIMLYKFYSL